MLLACETTEEMDDPIGLRLSAPPSSLPPHRSRRLSSSPPSPPLLPGASRRRLTRRSMLLSCSPPVGTAISAAAAVSFARLRDHAPNPLPSPRYTFCEGMRQEESRLTHERENSEAVVELAARMMLVASLPFALLFFPCLTWHTAPCRAQSPASDDQPFGESLPFPPFESLSPPSRPSCWILLRASDASIAPNILHALSLPKGIIDNGPE